MQAIKAQGAIEYLLIIGAAILVVAIVIFALIGTSNPKQTKDAQTAENIRLNTIKCIANIDSLGSTAGSLPDLCPRSITYCECCSKISTKIDVTKINNGIKCN